MKKLLSLILVLAVTLCLSVSAFAANGDSSPEKSEPTLVISEDGTAAVITLEDGTKIDVPAADLRITVVTAQVASDEVIQSAVENIDVPEGMYIQDVLKVEIIGDTATYLEQYGMIDVTFTLDVNSDALEALRLFYTANGLEWDELYNFILNGDGTVTISITAEGYIAVLLKETAATVSYDGPLSPQTGDYSSETVVFAIAIIFAGAMLVKAFARKQKNAA